MSKPAVVILAGFAASVAFLHWTIDRYLRSHIPQAQPEAEEKEAVAA